MFSNLLGSLHRDRPVRATGFILAAAVVIALVTGMGAARAQDCASESTVKSTQAGAAVVLSFRNASNERRRIYWLDQNGTRKFYGLVEPQHILRQPTYAGHAWVVTDEAEKCLSIVTATDQAMTVDVGGGSVGQVTPPAPGAEVAIAPPQPGAVAAPAPPQEQADAAAPEQNAADADQVPQVSPIKQFHLRGAYKLVPRDGPTKALNNESSGSVEITRVKPAWESGKWTFEEVPGTPYVRIKNDWKHTYLADRDGRLRTVKADDDDQDAHWSFEPVDGTSYVQLRNRKSGVICSRRMAIRSWPSTSPRNMKTAATGRSPRRRGPRRWKTTRWMTPMRRRSPIAARSAAIGPARRAARATARSWHARAVLCGHARMTNANGRAATVARLGRCITGAAAST